MREERELWENDRKDPASPEIPMEVLTDSNVVDTGKNCGGNGAAGENETGIDDFYGYYRLTEFWPTIYYSALEFDALPIQEADMMIGQEIRIKEKNFITYDNFRLPNSIIVGRAMDEFLLEEVNISDPD